MRPLVCQTANLTIFLIGAVGNVCIIYQQKEKEMIDDRSQEIKTKYRETQMLKAKVQVTLFQIKASFTIERSFPYDM